VDRRDQGPVVRRKRRFRRMVDARAPLHRDDPGLIPLPAGAAVRPA
jgi:hypothetical protein